MKHPFDPNFTCEKCIFAVRVRVNPTDLHESLECRGAPPVPAITAVNQRGEATVSFLPRIVSKEWWCGAGKMMNAPALDVPLQ